MLSLAKQTDIEAIMTIIDSAKKRMKADNLIQWQDGYPNRDTVSEDIQKSQMYKIEIDNCIAGICVINDDYYSQYQNTPDKSKCLMIHRVAVNDQFLKHGIGLKLLNGSCEIIKQQGYEYAVVDTNSQNLKMINLIDRAGFEYVSDFELVANAPLWKVFVKRLSV